MRVHFGEFHGTLVGPLWLTQANKASYKVTHVNTIPIEVSLISEFYVEKMFFLIEKKFNKKIFNWKETFNLKNQ
jgi:hypothetical protein